MTAQFQRLILVIPFITFFCTPAWAETDACKYMMFVADDFCSRPLASIYCPEECGAGSGRPPTREKALSKDESLLECCRAQGVPSQCLKICQYFPKEDVSCEIGCAGSFRKLIYCAANNQDNRQCCQGKALAPHCQQFCNGREPFTFPTLDDMFYDIPKSLKYSECFNKGSDIMQCHYDSAPSTKEYTRASGSWGPEQQFPITMKATAENFCRNRKLQGK